MDISYLLFLQRAREAVGGVADGFFLRVTSLGEGIITYLLLAFVYWCVDKRSGQLMALNVSVACTWNQFMKNICKVERPWVLDERIVPVQSALAGAGGYSFPSGHTQRAAAVWGSLGASLLKDGKKGPQGLLSGVCFSIVALIAFSRNYLGVHTLKDVFAALAMGVIFILLLERVMRWAEEGKNRDVIVAAAGCALCFCPMLKVGCLSNAGAGMGFMIGWVLERRFVRFEVEDAWTSKCVRFALGGAGIVFILTVLQAVLGLVMPGKYAGFFSSFILAVFILAVYPFFFSKKKRYAAGIGILAVLMIGMAVFSFGWQRHLRLTAQDMAVENGQEISEQADGQGAADSAPGDEAAGQETFLTEADGIPKIIAHRGYSGQFPENTLAAFAGALDIGADYIELDVQLSKDGQVVILHDDSLKRTTGVDGKVSDFTYEELAGLDAGAWFDASFAGEKIPTLEEALTLIRDTQCGVYLELKDIGQVEGFEEAVLKVVNECGMTNRCLFASFQYRYLQHLKELDPELKTLYNTSSGKKSLPEEFPADYYGLSVETVSQETVGAIHQAGKQAFVWTVNTPAQIKNVRLMGADGMVTNHPGLAKVIRQPEYEYLAEHYEKSFALPGLYEQDLPEVCEDVVVQGFTKAGNTLVISAYSKSGEYNSILYVMNLNGKLLKVVDLNFKAHTGGIAYDESHDLLWVTGPEGKVYAISWSDVMAGTYQGEILVEFDGGLVNHGGSKVASFLTFFDGELFVGSYVNGSNGMLNRYDLTEVTEPDLVSAVVIPQRIQGVTFKKDAVSGECYMFLSQGYQTEDSYLLKFLYDREITSYTEPVESSVLPEGVEQVQMSAGGMYILFESAARPYRPTARIPNDQVFLVRE